MNDASGNPESDRLTLKHHLVAAGLVGAWSLFTAFSYVATYYQSSRSRGRDFSWYHDAVPVLICYGVWIVLAPLMLSICHWFRFRRDAWLLPVTIHLVSGFGLGALRALVSNGTINAIFGSSNPLFGIGPSLLGGTTYWIFLLAYSGHLYYLRFREREVRTTELEGELARAQVEALRMQLQPHFLFNTLNTIASLSYHDVKAANRMISRLSDLLRISLDNIDCQEVTLKQEIDFLQKYLEIEKVRFEDRLEVELEIAAETLDAFVPSLILQPIVENAVRHGVGRIAEKGRIKVRAEKYGSLLHLAVADNGPGLPEGSAEDGPRLGLANTTSRLDKMYGREGRIELVDTGGSGLEVSLYLPFHESPLLKKDVKGVRP